MGPQIVTYASTKTCVAGKSISYNANRRNALPTGSNRGDKGFFGDSDCSGFNRNGRRLGSIYLAFHNSPNSTLF